MTEDAAPSTPLEQLTEALAKLARIQGHSQNPITRQWGVVHAAAINWVEDIDRRVTALSEPTELEAALETTEVDAAELAEALAAAMRRLEDDADAWGRLSSTAPGLVAELNQLADEYGPLGVQLTIQAMRDAMADDLDRYRALVRPGEATGGPESAPTEPSAPIAQPSLPKPPPPPVAPEATGWDFTNERGERSTSTVPLRNLTITPIVHEVTDDEVVVRVYATAPGWQRVRVFMEPGAEFDIDMAGRDDPLATGEYRYTRPAVSHEQEISVTGYSEASDSATVRTKLWLPQRERGEEGTPIDTLDVEAMEPPPPDEG